jgi:hypothetical protein
MSILYIIISYNKIKKPTYIKETACKISALPLSEEAARPAIMNQGN